MPPAKSTRYCVDVNHCVRGSLSKSVVSPQVEVHQVYRLPATNSTSRVDNKILLYQPIGTGPETTWDASSTDITTCGTSLYETVSSTSTSTTTCHHPKSTGMPDSSTRVSTSTSTRTNSSPLPTRTFMRESELANNIWPTASLRNSSISTIIPSHNELVSPSSEHPLSDSRPNVSPRGRFFVFKSFLKSQSLFRVQSFGTSHDDTFAPVAIAFIFACCT